MSLQHLSLRLDGITAGDYLTWVRDPEPPALGIGLDSIAVSAEPLGDTIEAVLSWSVPPPSPHAAAAAAGLPPTPEVLALECRQVAQYCWSRTDASHRVRARQCARIAER
jgi:hypothetical protein